MCKKRGLTGAFPVWPPTIDSEDGGDYYGRKTD